MQWPGTNFDIRRLGAHRIIIRYVGIEREGGREREREGEGEREREIERERQMDREKERERNIQVPSFCLTFRHFFYNKVPLWMHDCSLKK